MLGCTRDLRRCKLSYPPVRCKSKTENDVTVSVSQTDENDVTVSASQTDEMPITFEIKKRVLLELGMSAELAEA